MSTISFHRGWFLFWVFFVLALTGGGAWYFYRQAKLNQRLAYESGYTKGHDVGYTAGRIWGLNLGDSVGFVRGVNMNYEKLLAVDSLFRKLDEGLRPTIDYVQIVDAVAEVGAKNAVNDAVSFNHVMNDVYDGLLQLLSKQYGFTDRDRQKIMSRFAAYSNKTTVSPYRQMAELNSTIRRDQPQTLASRYYYDAVGNFEKVLQNQLSKWVAVVTAEITTSPIESKLVSMGAAEICQVVMEGPIKRFVQELRKAAIIRDYDVVSGVIESQMRSYITQLATAEHHEERLYDHDFVTQVLGIFSSTANLRLRVGSTVKAGFNLNRLFSLSIDHTTRTIEIHLPEPCILSHELNPRIENIDNGLFSTIDENRLNCAQDYARRILLNDAINAGIYTDANAHVADIIRVMFRPVSNAMPVPYSLVLQIGSGQRQTLLDYSNLRLPSL